MIARGVTGSGCSAGIEVTNADDSGAGSLRQAVLGVCPGGTITFQDRFVIDLDSEIAIDKPLTIDGSSVAGDATDDGELLVQINGGVDHRIFVVDAGGDLTLQSVRVSNGSVDGNGGAIENLGRLAVFDSRFDGNVAAGSGGLGGGAIYSGGDAELVVDGSLFDGNESFRGGAIFSEGRAELSNSTFVDNAGVTNEGAIQNRGTLVATHVTVAYNGGPGAGFGGLFAFNADTTLINSVFVGASGDADACSISGGTITAIALLATSGNCGQQFFADPQLQPLAANGGPTRTLALPAGSAAIDAGDAEFCLPTDQRGVARPFGAGCDLGAFEFNDDRIFGDGFDGGLPTGSTR